MLPIDVGRDQRQVFGIVMLKRQAHASDRAPVSGWMVGGSTVCRPRADQVANALAVDIPAL